MEGIRKYMETRDVPYLRDKKKLRVEWVVMIGQDKMKLFEFVSLKTKKKMQLLGVFAV